MIFTRIIVGLIIIVVGYFITARSEWLLQNFGSIDFFEQHFGSSGGTRAFYKTLGVIVIVLAFMYMTGLLQEALNTIFSPITKGLQQ